MKYSKHVLADLKVKSFVTSLVPTHIDTLKGGTVCPSINACPFSDTIEPLVDTETCHSTGVGGDPSGPTL